MKFQPQSTLRNLACYATLIATCSLLMTSISFAASRGITLTKTDTSKNRVVTGGTYRALIIGNNQYKDPENRWNPLKTAISDAEAVRDILKTDYGFSDIVFLKNAGRRDVLQALSGLSRRVMPDDSILVYYAGHGYLDPDTRKGYWVPVDARGFDSTTYLRNSTIRDELGTISSRAKHTLLISDSCFSGTLLRSGTRGITVPDNSERYYNKVASKKSVQIMAAGGVEFVDDNYRGSGHSPFTYFLLDELKSNNKPLITASEMSGKLEKAVASNANQTPESGVLQGAGDESGEFIFIKLKVDVQVKGVPKDKVKVEVSVSPESKATVIPTGSKLAKPGPQLKVETHTIVTPDTEPKTAPATKPDTDVFHFPTL